MCQLHIAIPICPGETLIINIGHWNRPIVGIFVKDNNQLEIRSVPEEIVDNSDLGDPEGMLQLSRVRRLIYISRDKNVTLKKCSS